MSGLAAEVILSGLAAKPMLNGLASKVTLSGLAAKIGLSGWAAKTTWNNFGRLYNVKSCLSLSLPFTGVETLHPSHIP